MKHTPTPWAWSRFDDGGRQFIHRRDKDWGDGVIIGSDDESLDVDVEFIVLAVNSHDALLEALRRIAAEEEPDKNPNPPDNDPYRCPTCDKPMTRGGSSVREMYCSEHPGVRARYDDARASRGAAASFQPAPCGCQADSGIYISKCEKHDPVSIASAAIAASSLATSPGTPDSE